jgi:hypothetical protein
MDLDKITVFDIETNGMLEDLDRLHVMSIGYISDNGKWSIESMNDEDRIKSFFENPNNVMLGHNIIMYDIPAIEKLYPGVDIKCEIIDTLPISWYLYNERPKHSLESWGETFSTSETKKVAIDDWENLSYEDYVERCEGDIRINTNLWVKSLKLFRSLYDSDEEIVSVIKYLNFKTKCLKLQNDNPLRIDVEQAKKNLEYLNKIIEEKKEELKTIMPKIPKYRLVSKPKNGLYKKDGSLSVAGEKWLTYLDGCGLSQDYGGEIKILHSEEEPNPASTLQIKDFLVSKGWKPKIFKDGANGKVAQLRDDNKNLCKSIYKLIEEYPELEALDGLSVAQHRYGILKGIVESVDENGYAPAQANGFTKTFRLKHKKPFVNLPKPTQKYGELIRSIIIAPEGFSVIGSDVGSLEDKTKQIAIYSYDKEYVEQMNTKGFDAHLDIGLSANMFSESEVEFFKWYKSWEKEKDESVIPEKYKNTTLLQMEELYGKLSKKRHVAKTINYSCTYGAGAVKVSESAKISVKEAESIIDAYWKRNWSVKQYAEDRKVKNVDGKDWVYNPYSKLWLYLTSDHIKFSACNQNSGAKFFDTWVYFMMQYGILPSAQFHDEVLLYVKKGEEGAVKDNLHKAMDKVNRAYELPIILEVDVLVGDNYAEVH